MSQMRVLIVATSQSQLADSKRPTGAWAEEVAVPCYVFRQKGYVVELASPGGGIIPLDPGSVTPEVQRRCPEVRRFLADGEAVAALQSATSIVFARHSIYDAIYVAGGHGIMWDGSVNEELKTLLENALAVGATVAACGHGGVAMLDVKDSKTGDFYVKNKQVTGTTWDDELAASMTHWLPSNPVHRFGQTAFDAVLQVTGPTRDDEMANGRADQVPFPLPEEFKKRGAIFSHADTIDAPWAVRSGQLVTGQNANAAKRVAELVVEAETFGVRVTP